MNDFLEGGNWQRGLHIDYRCLTGMEVQYGHLPCWEIDTDGLQDRWISIIVRGGFFTFLDGGNVNDGVDAGFFAYTYSAFQRKTELFSFYEVDTEGLPDRWKAIVLGQTGWTNGFLL